MACRCQRPQVRQNITPRTNLQDREHSEGKHRDSRHGKHRHKSTQNTRPQSLAHTQHGHKEGPWARVDTVKLRQTEKTGAFKRTGRSEPGKARAIAVVGQKIATGKACTVASATMYSRLGVTYVVQPTLETRYALLAPPLSGCYLLPLILHVSNLTEQVRL